MLFLSTAAMRAHASIVKSDEVIFTSVVMPRPTFSEWSAYAGCQVKPVLYIPSVERVITPRSPVTLLNTSPPSSSRGQQPSSPSSRPLAARM